jgi:hypothetical protein
MDISSALIFSAHMVCAYCIVLWIQYSSWKEIKVNTEKLNKALLDLQAEINSLKKSSTAVSVEPKKILVDQKSLYSLK